VDEVLCYVTGRGPQARRYYASANHLYSVAALTGERLPDGTIPVVERYRFMAYGQQRITDASGNVTRQKSAVGWDRSFVGYVADNETGLMYARFRMYSPGLGRFVGRDPQQIREVIKGDAVLYEGNPEAGNGYPDGFSLYAAYFSPNKLDPSGEESCDCTCEPTPVSAPPSYFANLNPGRWDVKTDLGIFSERRDGACYGCYDRFEIQGRKKIQRFAPRSRHLIGDMNDTAGDIADALVQAETPGIGAAREDINRPRGPGQRPGPGNPFQLLGGPMAHWRQVPVLIGECTCVYKCHICVF
jgi:RHS repeat-associated protein